MSLFQTPRSAEFGCVALASLITLLLAPQLSLAQPIDHSFFESRIRPVLVERCYECHNSSGRAEGDLALDHRQALLDGGANGSAIEPGNAQESLLWQALRFDGELRMPEGGPKLEPAVLADFKAWIDAGAFDPRDSAPAESEIAALTSWEAVRDRRMTWWSFQPLVSHPLPESPASLPAPTSLTEQIDRRIQIKLAEHELTLAPAADRATLIRRLSWVLTGLPPTPEELQRFTAGDEASWTNTQYAAAVEHYLASPAFGERWARHWMDWFRYADSHGSEGDPAIPNAWRYRDYLIRALNSDVPLDQMVREHLAGDLLSSPRRDPDSSANESIQGLGHFRMVQHGYAPVDPSDERIRFTDNQIDVVSKAFLGLTVSCARCHDHKFDPISQRDFYAWYGTFAAARPALVPIDADLEPAETIAALQSAKQQLRHDLAAAWRAGIPTALERLKSDQPQWRDKINEAESSSHPLNAWRRSHSLPKVDQSAELARTQTEWQTQLQEDQAWRTFQYPLRWSFSEPNAASSTRDWYRSGNGLQQGPVPAGAFRINPSGEQLVAQVFGAGEYTAALSSRRGGMLTSPTFVVDFDELWIAVSGREGSRVRFVVQNYPRVIGLLYMGTVPQSDTPVWVRWDMRYWKGEEVHIEIATEGDLSVGAGNEANHSWFGITDVVGRNADQPEPFDAGAPWGSANLEVGDSPHGLSTEVAYRTALSQAIDAWEAETIDSRSAEFLGYFVREGWLPNTLTELPQLQTSIENWRTLEASLPVVHRAPGVVQERPTDRPLLVRGDPRHPAETVPRGFLEAFTSTPFPAESTGRLELAEAIINDNPLFARVMANRAWHHLFGQGIVASCDNFGRLGEEPSHPELLDDLALQFSGAAVHSEGSSQPYQLKPLLKQIVMSRAFRAAAQHPDPRVAEIDASGRLRSHWTTHRLEAEAIRDGLLAITGVLDPTSMGPTVGGDVPRRSVYVRVQRNALDPLLTAFDAPIPFSTVGARPATNVPAQSLMLLNDPLVRRWAEQWANRLVTDPTLLNDRQRWEAMFSRALGRMPSEAETERGMLLLQTFANTRSELNQAREQLSQQLHGIDSQINVLESAAFARLNTDTSVKEIPIALQPTWRWSFDSAERLSEDAIPTQLHGDAIVSEGALVVSGSGWAQTEPLTKRLGARSFEAWVRLDDLDQQGGGVMSLESDGGAIFDAIVIGEQQARHWLAGSNFFDRTLPFNGTDESRAAESAVHLVWVYAADGTITAYRYGERYGSPIRKAALIEHAPGTARLVFGLRHSPAGGNRHLRGRILEANLFDRDLTADEVAARSELGPAGSVSTEKMLAAMNAQEKDEWHRLNAVRSELRAAMNELTAQIGATPEGPVADWTNVGLTLLNMKELIYLD